MTQEEKAKRYDEVLNRLRRFMAQGVDPLITRADVQDFFPELRESEDERIRKAIIDYFRWNPDGQLLDEFSNIEVFAWLEKQHKPADKVEQKPAWSKQDETLLNCCLGAVNTTAYFDKYYKDEMSNWLKSLKDRYTLKPSEEHIHWIKWAVNRMPDTEKANEAEAVLEDLLEQLKKLREE